YPNRVPSLPAPAAGHAAPGAGLVIHPGAGGRDKRWPAQHYARLARELDLPLAISAGPADERCLEELLPLLDRPYTLLRDLPLNELAEIIRGAALFVGNDTGITHIAAAVGAPTIGIYIETEPSIWGIRGPNTRVLQGEVAASAVIAAARTLR